MNSNDFDTSQKYKIKSSECTQIKRKQTYWEFRECTLSRLSRFLKVTKPILLLSSFGEFTNVLYNDKGLSSVTPVYKLSMVARLYNSAEILQAWSWTCKMQYVEFCYWMNYRAVAWNIMKTTLHCEIKF